MAEVVTCREPMASSTNGHIPAIAVRDLAKNYGEVEAVRGVNFEVAVGEVFGFLGPNGAGKTTTINMLCTLANPTSGSAFVSGHNVVSERDEVRRNIGLVFQDPTLDGYMSGEQNLRMHAELYGVQRDLVAPGWSRCCGWSGCGNGRTPWPAPTRAGCGAGSRSRAG